MRPSRASHRAAPGPRLASGRLAAVGIVAVLLTAITLPAQAALLAPAALVPPGATLLSQGGTATASSAQDRGALSPFAAFDGNPATRFASAGTDSEWLQVDLGRRAELSAVVLDWETAYGRDYQIQVSEDATSWTTVHTTVGGTGGDEVLTVSGTGRYVRMVGTRRGTIWGYSLWEMQVYGTALPDVGPACGTQDVALGRPATASSAERSGLAPSFAVDGNPATRWSSAFAEPQWIQVDLGARRDVCRVALRWETAYGRTVTVQTSRDGVAWTAAAGSTDGWGGPQSFDVTAAARYVRLALSDRVTIYGVSLWSLEVFASDGAGPAPLPAVGSLTSTGTGTATQQVTAPVPAGASVSLLDAEGAAATVVWVPGEGSYALDAASGTVGFAPVLGFAGTAAGVDVRLTDTWDQDSTGTYRPVVLAPTAPATLSTTSSGVGAAVQSAVVPVPTGGSVLLRAIDGAPAVEVEVPGQGLFTLEPTTGAVTFTPTAGFVGRSDGVVVALTDAYGQVTLGRYVPTVVPVAAEARNVEAAGAKPAAGAAVAEVPGGATRRERPDAAAAGNAGAEVEPATGSAGVVAVPHGTSAREPLPAAAAVGGLMTLAVLLVAAVAWLTVRRPEPRPLALGQGDS